MKSQLKHYAQAILTIFVLLAIFWSWQWIDGEHDSIPFATPEKQNITATSTIEFDFSGIENRDKLTNRIEILIEETKATQQKQEATKRLEELQRKKTSLR